MKLVVVSAVVALLAACVAGHRVVDELVAANNARHLLASLGGKPIKIGMLHPYVTGESNDGTLGQTLTDINAAYFAIADLGAKVQMVVRAGGCDTAKVNDTIREMVEVQQVHAVLGPVCSSAALGAVPLLGELGVPAFAFSAFADAISGASPLMYRTALSGVQATAPLVDVMRQEYKTAVFIRDSGISARDYTKAAVDRYTDASSTLPGSAGENLGEFVFDGAMSSAEEVEALVQQALELQPDAVFYMVSFLSTKPELTTAAISAARAANADLPFLYANTLHRETYDALKDADGKAPLLKGILSIQSGSSPKTDERYDKAFGYPTLPNFNIRPEIGVYAATSAIITAARHSGKAAPGAKDIQAVLQKPGFTFKAWGGAEGKFQPNTNDLIQEVTVVIMDEYSKLSPYDALGQH